MQKTCNGCRTNGNTLIPFAVHEADMARSERNNKRLWIAVIILIVALLATNIAWLLYNSRVDTITDEYTIEQEASGSGTNNSIIGGGNISDGETENTFQEDYSS